MLRRLRKKIVAIVMSISGAVLLFAFAAMLVMNYANSYSTIRESMHAAVERGPVFDVTFSIGRRSFDLEVGVLEHSQDSDGDTDDSRFFDMPPEDRRGGGLGMTPCAVFVVDENGTVLQDNTDFVAMDAQTAATALSHVLASDKDEGYVSDAEVYYLRDSLDDGNSIVAFADALPVRDSLKQLAGNMALVGALVLLGLFGASVVLARIATRPVEQAWDQQRRFVADASHELKTPLTVILANTGILADDPDVTQEQSKWLASTKDEAVHMKGLIDEMLTLARSDETANQAKEAFSEVDLSDTVMRGILAFDAVAFESGVAIVDDVEPNLHVDGDPLQLERLVKILVDNAVKYAGNGGEVSVALGTQKGKALLRVRNTGSVIPADQLPHVFDRFWRSDEARTRTSGGSYGLGLAIAKSIADAHSAAIEVQSDDVNGTEFIVRFPLHK